MRRAVFGLILLLLSLAACKNMPQKGTDYHLPDMVSLSRMEATGSSPEKNKEIGDSLMSANRDLQASQLYIEAAIHYHEAGAEADMLAAMHRAIDHGMANPKILRQFQGHQAILGSLEGKRLLKRLDSIQGQLGQVTHYRLETRSLEQFWPYFERALSDTSKARQELKRFLFDGPPEIRDFYTVRYGNLDLMFGQMINASPDYYRYLRSQVRPDSLQAVQATTKQWMLKFKTLYPEAVFPKVYVVPGILNSGGTVTEMGMFIGGDMYGRSPDMPTDGLSDWQRNSIMTFDQLPGLTIHELMHFQQNYRDTLNSDRVMGAILGEGVCDFLLELSSGIPLENDNLDYLKDPGNYTFIMADLKADLYNSDNSRWLYNGGSIEDRPVDLGYTLGYLISKSYYEKQDDKKQAVYELLNTNDFESIYRESAYRFLLETDSSIAILK